MLVVVEMYQHQCLRVVAYSGGIPFNFSNSLRWVGQPVLAIIDIPNVTILNHTADTNRNADIPSREGHLTCSGMNNGL